MMQAFVCVLLFFGLNTGVAADFTYMFGCPPPYYANYTGSQCRLLVSVANQTADFTVSTVDGTTEVTLQPGERYFQDMDWTYLAVNGTTDKVITVHSDTYIQVLLQYRRLSEIETAQIQHIYDAPGQYTYYLVSLPPTSGSSFEYDQFYTLSTLAESNIEIYRDGNLLDSFSLHEDNVYNFIELTTIGFDITGTVIHSDRPLSIVCGAIKNPNPDFSGAFITDVSQLPSRHFVAPHLGNQNDTGYDVRIIAASDNTIVTVDGEEQAMLDEGEFIIIDFEGRTNTSDIECSEDCHAYSLLRGVGDFRIGSLFSLISTSDLYESAYFITPEYTNVYAHFLSLVLEGDDTESITLDGMSLAGEYWEFVEGFSYVWLEVEAGQHWLESSGGRFAAYVYGYRSYSPYYGYGHSILPGTPPSSRLPSYVISTNGTAVTSDATDISQACVTTNHYQSTMSARTTQIQVVHYYELEISYHHDNAAIATCSQEISDYVSEHGNWLRPILPGSDQCPEMVFTPERFDHNGYIWRCQSSYDLDLSSAVNQLLYQQQVMDDLTTDDGSDLTTDCKLRYQDAWHSELSDMKTRTNGELEELCDGDMAQVVNTLGVFTDFGSQVFLTGDFYLEPATDVSFVEFLECTDKLQDYLTERENWGNPFLPIPPGCPALVPDGDLQGGNQDWKCSASI